MFVCRWHCTACTAQTTDSMPLRFVLFGPESHTIVRFFLFPRCACVCQQNGLLCESIRCSHPNPTVRWHIPPHLDFVSMRCAYKRCSHQHPLIQIAVHTAQPNGSDRSLAAARKRARTHACSRTSNSSAPQIMYTHPTNNTPICLL